MSEMKINEALAPFEAEYARLFEALYEARRTERHLSDNIALLKVRSRGDPRSSTTIYVERVARSNHFFHRKTS